MDPALWEVLQVSTDPAEEVEAIIRLDRPQFAIAGVRIVSRFGPIATCRLRRDSVLGTREEENVRSLKAARLLGPEFETEETNATLGLPLTPVDSDERRPFGLSLDGAGVCIGIIDWGCDFDHPNFKHPDGTTRLIALWDQRGRPQRGASSYYGYGTFYNRQQINRALRSADAYGALGYHPADSDPVGSGAHGTHVMDIAAGNGLGGDPVGVAPAADLIFVHLADRGTGGLANLGDSVRILEALDFVAKTAGRRPWVVNLSVGRHGGPHDGSTLAEMAFDLALQATPGRFIVQSTGNYFNKQIHASGRLQLGQAQPLSFIVDEADITPNELEVWYCGGDELAVRIESPTKITYPWVRLGEQADVSANGRIVGRIYNRASDPNNSDNHIDIFLYPDAPPGLWTVTLKADKVFGGIFHAWLERDEACPGCQTRFSEFDSDNFYTTGTLANSRIPLVVGAYDAHSPVREVAHFSSVGPTRDNRPKPDLVAPGVGVLAARSAPSGWRKSSGMLVRKSGTSMAAPHVTGAVALCLQGARRPLWSHEIRELFLSNVEPLAAHVQNALRFGRGYLDVAKLVEAVSALSPHPTTSSVFRLNGHKNHTHYGKELKMKPKFAEYVDPLEQVVKESTSRAPSERDLLAEIIRTNGAPLYSTSLDPDELYREIVYNRSGPLSAMIDERFTVLARPGESPEVPPQAGDLLLRVALGEPGLGHVALISDSTLWPHEQLPSAPFSSEIPQPGFYATVIEGGAFPHTLSDKFARRILDSEGRMPPGQLLLSLKSSLDDENSRSWFDEAAERRGVVDYNSAAFAAELSSGTFARIPEYPGGERRGIEIEATMHLVCLDAGKTIDPKQLYGLLWRDDWRAFQDIRRCAKCAAFSSGFGVAAMPWDQVSHELREKNPYVWLTVEPGRFDRGEQRIERKVDLATDLFDDFYFDDDHFTLLANSYLLRGRRRWDSWRRDDEPQIRRLLIATKKIEGVGPDGVKQGQKRDIRLPNRRDRVVLPRHRASLVGDIQSGFVDWTRNRTARRRNRRAIGPIKVMYNDLRGGRQEFVLDLKPQVFIRSLRSRYHLRETSLAAVENIRQNGEARLKTLRASVEQALRENSLDSALRPNAQAFVNKVRGTLDFSLVADRTRNQLTNLHPGMRVDAPSVRALRPRPPSRRELEKQKVVAETISKLYHELAENVNKQGLLDATSGVSVDEGQEWTRQIEAAGSAALGLWFDRTRRFYVPRSGRAVNDDFLIDTLDASGMFTPDAWAGVSEAEQTSAKDPDISKLFHATLTNEIQIELRRQGAYLDRIRELERRIAEATRPRQNLEALLTGAKFVLERYRDTMATLVQMKEDQVISGIKTAVATARQAGHAVPDCKDWAWRPVTQGKGETALSILQRRKQQP